MNTFFAKQYSLIKNESELPTSLTFYTDNCLSAACFSHEDVGKIIQNVNPNKAHGHGYISICMLKICGWTIYRSLERIFDRGSKYWFASIRMEKEEHCSYHKTIIRTGRRCLVICATQVKIFWNYAKYFWIFPCERNCRIFIGLWK